MDFAGHIPLAVNGGAFGSADIKAKKASHGWRLFWWGAGHHLLKCVMPGTVVV
jgi:hypothetical protein